MTRSDNTIELNFTFEVNEPVITGHDEMELLSISSYQSNSKYRTEAKLPK